MSQSQVCRCIVLDLYDTKEYTVVLLDMLDQLSGHIQPIKTRLKTNKCLTATDILNSAANRNSLN